MQAECNLVLIRGVSGAGKSTVGKLFDTDSDTIVVSTDDMFMINGEYVFNPNMLTRYHQATIRRVEEYMKEYDWKIKDSDFSWFPSNKIVVCNTFTEKWEIQPYFDLAKKYDWCVHTIIVENRHNSDSIHDVPQKNVDEQRERFEIVL